MNATSAAPDDTAGDPDRSVSRRVVVDLDDLQPLLAQALFDVSTWVDRAGARRHADAVVALLARVGTPAAADAPAAPDAEEHRIPAQRDGWVGLATGRAPELG